MRRNILLFGLILGAILCVNMVIMVNQVCSNPDFSGSNIFGFAILIFAMALIFIGIHNYRNNELIGVITFWKAMKVSALITFFASTMYVVVQLFYYYLFVPDFLDKYIAHTLKTATQNGTLESATKQAEYLKGMYKNPFGIAIVTYIEVLPLGFLVALVSAVIIRRSKSVSAN